jgi:hypothetical protein
MMMRRIRSEQMSAPAVPPAITCFQNGNDGRSLLDRATAAADRTLDTADDDDADVATDVIMTY